MLKRIIYPFNYFNVQDHDLNVIQISFFLALEEGKEDDIYEKEATSS